MAQNKHINTFSHGINQDLSTNKYPNTNIYWAQNFRLISKDGLATGALTNIGGTLPKLGTGGGHTIVETCLIRDTLVLFVNSDEGGKIMIWESNDNDFQESPTLIYTDPNLDFSGTVRAIGRYETSNIQKIYFTDGESFFKHLNIIPETGSGYPLTYDIDSLDLVSDIDFSTISLELQSGGNLRAGKIQYAYQLYSKRGSESTFSPASQLIHLTEYDETRQSIDYYGSEVGAPINKSVSVTINNTDPLFTRLRLVALEYTVLSQPPSVRIVGEYNIEGLSSINIVDTGTSLGELTLEEYRFIQNDFYPKTLDIKNDYLFAANIVNNYFEITDDEFDARAFRANASNTINVYNGNSLVNIPYPFSSETLPSTSQELFNPYNDISNDYTGDVATDGDTYKYLPGSSGTTLGGKGVNIEYEFEIEQIVLDDVLKSYDWEEGYARVQINASALFENNASPLAKVGYQRDEVYRFAIVFFDKKGRQSFAKWIGDIRFPTNRERPFISYNNNDDKTYANILGITFTVDTTSIADKISGYQIVRAERTNSDKTILSQGLVGYPVYTSIGESGDEDHLYSLATQPLVRDMYNRYTSYERECETYNGISGPARYEYNDSDIKLDPTYVEFESPDIVINKNKLTTNEAYLDIFGYQNEVENIATSGTRGFEDNDPGDLGDRDIIVADKSRNIAFEPGTNRLKTDVTNFRLYSPKTVGVAGDADDNATKNVIDGGQIYNNQAYAPAPASTNSKSKWGLRGTHSLLNIENPIAINSNWLDNSEPLRFLTANYRVFRGRSIYGGSTSEARSYTKYYPASEFIDSSTSTIDVFGGDTYISYFAYLRSIYDNTGVRINGYRIESYQFYPVESTINLNLRLDRMQNYINWGLYRDSGVTDYKLTETASLGVSIYGTNYPAEVGDLYRYNTAYSATDKSKEFYARPFDFSQNLTNDTRITASEKKINGEYVDNWTKFKFNNYIDVDSKHNAITKIITFKNNLFFFQPTAVGVASVNDRSLIQDNNAGQLTLGTGGILPRYDYITDKSGSAYYDAILASDDYLFYADGRRKRINKIVPGKEVAVSVVKGIDSTLDKLSWETVRAGFDRGYNEVIFAIDSTTLAFNEMADAFSSSYTFNPNKMFSIGDNFYSIANSQDESPWLYNDIETSVVSYSDDVDNDYIVIGPSTSGETLFKHNAGDPGVFYGGDGTGQDSYITLIINPAGNTVCYFDNLDLRTESTSSGVDDPDDIFYRLEASNNYQEISRELAFLMDQTDPDKGYKYNSGSIKRIGRVWRTPIVSDASSGGSYYRMIDTYLKVTLRYSNTGNSFRVHDITTYFRPSRH